MSEFLNRIIIRQRGSDNMKKPTYYLWRSDFSTQENYEQTKENFTRLGFRTVTYLDGSENENIHDGIKQLIRNHYDRKSG